MEIPNGIYHIRILIIRTKRRMPEPMLAGSGIWLGGATDVNPTTHLSALIL